MVYGRRSGAEWNSIGHDLKRQADIEYFDRVELQFRVQAALDVRGLTKTVLLARKQVITNWFALAPQGFN